MESFRLYKHEKLCSRTAVNLLFSDGKSEFAYPLRVVYRIVPDAAASGARFLITVPKKKVRTAVGRVLMRRRIREAYRLNRRFLLPALAEKGIAIEMAFLYMDKELQPYLKIEDRMRTVLSKIATKATAQQPAEVTQPAEQQSVPTESSQPVEQQSVPAEVTQQGIDAAENNSENQQ